MTTTLAVAPVSSATPPGFVTSVLSTSALPEPDPPHEMRPAVVSASAPTSAAGLAREGKDFSRRFKLLSVNIGFMSRILFQPGPRMSANYADERSSARKVGTGSTFQP